MPNDKIETLERVYAHWERGDFSPAGAEFVDDDYVMWIDPDIPEGGGTYVGSEGVTRYMVGFLSAWDRLTITAHSLEEFGDHVVGRVTQRGAGRTSGVPSELHLFHVWTFREGRPVRLDVFRHEQDALAAVRVDH